MAPRQERLDRGVIVSLELGAAGQMHHHARATDRGIDAHVLQGDFQAQPFRDDLDGRRISAHPHVPARGSLAVEVDRVELDHSAMSISNSSAASSPATLTCCASA
jgi:hypothetical protein